MLLTIRMPIPPAQRPSSLPVPLLDQHLASMEQHERFTRLLAHNWQHYLSVGRPPVPYLLFMAQPVSITKTRA